MRRAPAFKTAFRIWPDAWAEYNFVPGYGQSLEVGGGATIISNTPSASSLMFESATLSAATLRPQYRLDYLAVSQALWYSGFSPALEQNDDTLTPPGHKETPERGCGDMIQQLILAENGPVAAAAYQSILSSAGFGGMSLAQLSPGAGLGHYERLAWQIGAAHALSSVAQKGFATQAIGWLQGEADYVLGTTRAAYLNGLIALRSALAGEAMAGRQSFSPPLIYGQIASHACLGVATPTIALAQLDAELAFPTLFGGSAPLYICDYLPADVHIDSPSTRWMGAYRGLTVKRRRYDGLPTWSGMMKILSAVRNGDGIDITVDNLAPLAFDTTWVTAVADGNYGVQVVDVGLAPVIVTGVTITGAHTIRAACVDGGGPGSRVRTGWAGPLGGTPGRVAGPRTNIRDSYGDTLTFEVTPGDVRPMHRWLAMQDFPTTSPP